MSVRSNSGRVSTLAAGAGLSAALFGCGGPGSEPERPGSSLERPRIAPGIALDPSFDFPGATTKASASERFVGLAVGPSDRTAHTLVERLFQAIAAESGARLNLLFTEQATASFPGASERGAHVAWLRRFSDGNYRGLSVRRMYRKENVQLYREEEASKLGRSRHLHFTPEKDEIVAIIPLLTSTVSGQRLFGTEMQLLLSTADGELSIAATYEDLSMR